MPDEYERLADEARQDLHALADVRLAKLAETGEVVEWTEMRTCLHERATDYPPMLMGCRLPRRML